MAQVIERFLELIDWIISFFVEPKEGYEGIRRKSIKMIFMWLLACVLGFLFCYWLDLNLMKRLDVNVNIWIDRLLTALVLGSGTKPIHDVITLMERGKKGKA